MFKNYLKTSWRSLMKNKFFSIINVSGLAIGLACFVLIGAFVYDEMIYDHYPAEARNICRVNLSVTGNGDVALYPEVDDGVGPGMKNAFSEIIGFARLSPVSDFVKFDDKQFKEDKLAFCDSNFLKMFSIPLIEGSDDRALVQPNSIVISRSLAKKYFGDLKPLGKTLIVGLYNQPFNVTGVFDRVPGNTHFHYDAFLSMTTFPLRNPTWSNVGDFTYLLLNDGVDPKKLQSKFPALVSKYVVPEVQHDMGISLAEAEKTAGTFISISVLSSSPFCSF
jgi:putative ABC transport system permease protein